MSNMYHILGVGEDASQAEIKTAFKKLAVIYHPDKNPDRPDLGEHFKEINQAYQVLSNPYERARYDIQLKYGHTPVYPTYQEDPSFRANFKRKSTRTEPMIDWKENWIATAYAFAFTFVVALVVMSVLTIKNYLHEKEYKDLLATRRGSFEKAKTLFGKGQVDQALVVLNSLGAFFAPERDMEEYKRNLYDSFIRQGETFYNLGNYERAIYFYELMENYSSDNSIRLKEHLAKAYQKTRQPHKSIKKLKELLLVDYGTLEIYIDLAEIYRDQLSDVDEALRYYEVANKKATLQYQAYYGEAFPLLITAKHLPSTHYRLYTGLASSYLMAGYPEKALKAIRWNVRVWPDSVHSYVIAAESYTALENKAKACENYRIAGSLGFKGKQLTNCQ